MALGGGEQPPTSAALWDTKQSPPPPRGCLSPALYNTGRGQGGAALDGCRRAPRMAAPLRSAPLLPSRPVRHVGLC